MTTPAHLQWLQNTNETISTTDGRMISIYSLQYQNESNGILSQWSNHLRNHYCEDSELDLFIDGTGLTRKQFLEQIKFPDASNPPGPSIRSGDFAEILVSDFLEYFLKYWVPRGRFRNKAVRNESEKGCDVVGFKILDINSPSPDDELLIFESKAALATSSNNRLQDAINDSSKDMLRKAETLHAIKQRFIDKQQESDALKVQRFQNIEDRPFKEKFGAAAVVSNSCLDMNAIPNTTTTNHPHPDGLMLIIIKGDDLMKLVHELYRRAADEA